MDAPRATGLRFEGVSGVSFPSGSVRRIVWSKMMVLVAPNSRLKSLPAKGAVSLAHSEGREDSGDALVDLLVIHAPDLFLIRPILVPHLGLCPLTRQDPEPSRLGRDALRCVGADQGAEVVDRCTVGSENGVRWGEVWTGGGELELVGFLACNSRRLEGSVCRSRGRGRGRARRTIGRLAAEVDEVRLERGLGSGCEFSGREDSGGGHGASG